MVAPPIDRSPVARLDLARAPLSIDVASLLSDAIVRGALPPGSKLVETEICERYGVSRSPLREALGVLETRGLVVRRPRYGVRVAPLSIEHLDQIAQCRIPLEAISAANVAALPQRLEIARTLASHMDRMREAEGRGDVDACFDANAALIADLRRANPNQVLGRILADLDHTAQRYRYLVYRHRPETLRMLIESNLTMIAAISHGQTQNAHDITSKMVHDSWQDLRKILRDLIPAVEESVAPLVHPNWGAA
ncbi:MAG: GntR family transcriptional regulator [Proteobacteria bacterium]|nr:GntR family transcriptional regulator [Pseudomonadota bacterium]